MQSRPITARPITASGIAARPIFAGPESSNASYLFDFTTAQTALPSTLTTLSASYARNSLKTVAQGSGITTLSANQFGTEYDPVAGVYGFSSEPSSTNLMVNSENGTAGYTIINNVVDAGTSIAGFTTSVQVGDNTLYRRLERSLSTTLETPYVWSFYVQMDDNSAPVVGSAGTAGADFNVLLDNSNVAASIVTTERVGTSNIYRVYASFVATTTGNSSVGVRKQLVHSAKPFRVTGGQIEEGYVPTSYIKTTGSTASRAADELTVLASAIAGLSTTGYSLLLDFRLRVPAQDSRRGIVLDGGVADGSVLSFDATGAAEWTTYSDAVLEHSHTAEVTETARTRVAYSCKDGQFLTSVNGAASTSQLSGVMPLALTTLGIGFPYAFGVDWLNGLIYKAGIANYAMSQSELDAWGS